MRRAPILIAPDDAYLAEAAPLARRIAQESCRADPATHESCAWLHGLWPYLRLFGLASTPGQHAEFFVGALRAAAGDERRLRILVSGAADSAMLALAAHTCREDGVRPEITVLDQCKTPLRLNRWYAERIGLDIATVRADLLGYSEAQSFDAICTHSFLSEFPAERRPELLGAWRRLLRPGGVAITVNRLRPGGGSAAVGFTGEQARAFRAGVVERLDRLPGLPPVERAAIARDAETYIARRQSYALRSHEEALALFSDAGFETETLSCGPVAGAMPGAVSGPTTPGGAEYVRIVARRS